MVTVYSSLNYLGTLGGVVLSFHIANAHSVGGYLPKSYPGQISPHLFGLESRSQKLICVSVNKILNLESCILSKHILKLEGAL